MAMPGPLPGPGAAVVTGPIIIPFNQPFVNGVSAYFASLNRGKTSVALDLRAHTRLDGDVRRGARRT